MRCTLLCCSLLLTLCAGQVSAQITFDSCRNSQGRQVKSVTQNLGLIVAMASVQEGEPVILYDPGVLSFFHPVTRLFWYGHECGHHALGHLELGYQALSLEQQADCYSN